MPTVTEKSIEFNFPVGWNALKYDDTAFYRNKIEGRVASVRGVDVVAQAPSPDNRLFLIEVKDFRVSDSSAEQNMGKLRQTVIQKALNTLSGLFLATRTHDPELYPVVQHLLTPALQIEVILFLERPPLPVALGNTGQKLRRQNSQTAIGNLRLDLNSTLSALGLDFHLRDSLTMQPRDKWAVRV